MTESHKEKAKRLINEHISNLESRDPYLAYLEVVDFILENIEIIYYESQLDSYFAQKEEEAKQAKIASLQARLDGIDAEKAELQATLDELTK